MKVTDTTPRTERTFTIEVTANELHILVGAADREMNLYRYIDRAYPITDVCRDFVKQGTRVLG